MKKFFDDRTLSYEVKLEENTQIPIYSFENFHHEINTIKKITKDIYQNKQQLYIN